MGAILIPSLSESVDFDKYDKIVLFFSGGKDSVACFLSLLELGVKTEKVELMHHLIDGRGGERFMDYACTEGYCDAFADAFGVDIHYSWRDGGFLGEATRNNSFTGDKIVPDENGNLVRIEGSRNPKWKNTRMRFPQQSASLSTRYCSAYLKIDIGDIAVRRRFFYDGGDGSAERKILVISGERAEESSHRATYSKFERYRADNRDGKRAVRYIDHLRIVHQDKEQEIWDIMQRHSVRPHPAYRAGMSRTSCQFCIFSSADQWATMREYDPEGFAKILEYEKKFNLAINRSGSFIDKIADNGNIYDVEDGIFDIINNPIYTEDIIVSQWELPKGAYKGSEGGAP